MHRREDVSDLGKPSKPPRCRIAAPAGGALSHGRPFMISPTGSKTPPTRGDATFPVHGLGQQEQAKISRRSFACLPSRHCFHGRFDTSEVFGLFF
jgi:hypothetical protein